MLRLATGILLAILGSTGPSFAGGSEDGLDDTSGSSAMSIQVTPSCIGAVGAAAAQSCTASIVSTGPVHLGSNTHIVQVGRVNGARIVVTGPTNAAGGPASIVVGR